MSRTSLLLGSGLAAGSFLLLSLVAASQTTPQSTKSSGGSNQVVQAQPRPEPRRVPGNVPPPPAGERNPARGGAIGAERVGQDGRRPAADTRGGRAVDVAQEAQRGARDDGGNRPELKLTKQDDPERFKPANSPKSSIALDDQPEQGEIRGFDFARDPLNAKEPDAVNFEEVMAKDKADKPKIMEAQQKLLEQRYNLKPKLDPEVTMSRGKPIPVGPTARLPEGLQLADVAEMKPSEIRERNLFPYKPLPHVKHTPGGQVFTNIQVKQFPRLQRFDVDHDLPDAFLPEFPPAIFLQNRPELGDVSRGQVVTLENFHHLFKDLLTPVQLDGLRLLLTPLPQEEFNLTDDRKTAEPSLGVACLDCHVNGHTTGQFHLTPDIRPQHRRFRLDTTSLRGMFNQQIHGSKRSLRSVEDFTEFEQRTAYFNGDPIHAMKKGFTELPRTVIPHMAQFQNMLDFPPAPKLDIEGRLDPEKATESELNGEKIFHGKGRCATCHSGPHFIDHQMHDLKLERFTQEPGDGPIKTFTLRGIKDSPPYLHDGRCLTLEDTVEFFNLVQQLKLTDQEKTDLVAFLRQL
jgi:cytochrome c peroxidase